MLSNNTIRDYFKYLNIKNFTSEIFSGKPNNYYPAQSLVENIIKDNKGKLKLDPKIEQAISLLEESGNVIMAATLRTQNSSHVNKYSSFHYLSNRTNSGVEQTFLKEVLSFDRIGYFIF